MFCHYDSSSLWRICPTLCYELSRSAIQRFTKNLLSMVLALASLGNIQKHPQTANSGRCWNMWRIVSTARLRLLCGAIWGLGRSLGRWTLSQTETWPSATSFVLEHKSLLCPYALCDSCLFSSPFGASFCMHVSPMDISFSNPCVRFCVESRIEFRAKEGCLFKGAFQS